MENTLVVLYNDFSPPPPTKPRRRYYLGLHHPNPGGVPQGKTHVSSPGLQRPEVSLLKLVTLSCEQLLKITMKFSYQFMAPAAPGPAKQLLTFTF